MKTPEANPAEIKTPIIRDKAFAKRLEKACIENPNCPTDGVRGKQKWLRDRIEELFSITVTPEASRKWFAGEARPRPKVMSAIAQALEVDEAWLSLGLSPNETTIEKKKRNAVASGAVNYVAGLIQLSGGNIAFPEETGDSGFDFYAIIGGKQYQVEVKAFVSKPKGVEKLILKSKAKKNTLLLVLVTGAGSNTGYDLVHVPASIIEELGRSRGGFTEIEFKTNGSDYLVGDRTLGFVRDFRALAA